MVESTPSPRFLITYVGGFTCGLHDYKSNRAVYIIRDTQSGQEFLGLEGVGISSLRHEGKNASAER